MVFDIVEEKLALAKRFGADGVVNSGQEHYMDEVKAITDGRGFDYIYETAGNTITMRMAFSLVGKKGQICFIGTPTKEISFSVDEWENMNRKEFILTGSWMSYSAPFPGDEWELTAHYFKNWRIKV